MGESTKAADAVDKLVRAVGGKFTGLKYDVWKRTAQSVISMRHSGISDILEGRPCPEPIHIRPRPSSMASRPTRAVTRSQVVDGTASQPATGGPAPVGSSSTTQHGTGETPAADMEPSSPRTPTAQGADIQPVTATAESSPFPVSASVLWSTDDNISNIDDIQTWHRDNRLLYDFLFLSTSGAAASFLLKFKPKQGSPGVLGAAADSYERRRSPSTNSG